MWILPKNLPIFPSVQAMEGLISDSSELSEKFEQSLMWRSKPSSSRTWYRRLNQDTWMPRLSSQILNNSLGESLLDEWISSQEAFHANHFPPQEPRTQMQTLDIFGLTSQEELLNSENHPLCSSKMLKESSLANSKGQIGQIRKELRFCFISLESWKDWVTTQRQAYLARAKSVRLTKGKDYSFLVSDTHSKKIFGIPYNPSSQNPQTKMFHMKHWPTPKALEVNESPQQWLKRRQKPSAKMMGPSLTVAVQLPMSFWSKTPLKEKSPLLSQEIINWLQRPTFQPKNWATPTTMDNLPPRTEDALKRHMLYGARKGRTASGNLREQVVPYNFLQPTQRQEDVSNHGGNLQEFSIQPIFNWPTPCTRDYKDKNLSLKVSLEKLQVSLPITVNLEYAISQNLLTKINLRLSTYHENVRRSSSLNTPQNTYLGVLNPRWVEAMMGIPIGWTMPTCARVWTIKRMNCDF